MAKALEPPSGAPPAPGPSPAHKFVLAPPTDELQRLVQDNLGFVIKVACEYRNFGIPLEDLIGEGCVGLIHAAARFDPGRGNRFVTYAASWVRKSILRALSQNARTIRIPSYHLDQLKSYQRAESLLRGALGRRPGREEISTLLRQPMARVDALLNSRIFEISLEADPIRGGREIRFSTVADPGAADPERDLLRDESHLLIEEALRVLSPRERLIIAARFGLEEEHRASLRELAGALGLSRERVRQIESAAMRKIRLHLEKKVLCGESAGANMRAKNRGARSRPPENRSEPE